MSSVRTHFCTSATRFHGGVCWPSRYGLNGCIPATTNSSVGSSATRLAEGTMACPFASKYARNRRAISADCIVVILFIVCVCSEGRANPPRMPSQILVHARAHVTGEADRLAGPAPVRHLGGAPVGHDPADRADGEPEAPADHFTTSPGSARRAPRRSPTACHTPYPTAAARPTGPLTTVPARVRPKPA